MPFASAASMRAIGARAVPLAAAATIGVSFYYAQSKLAPLKCDPTFVELAPNPAGVKLVSLAAVGTNAFTPLAWGSNQFLTLAQNPEIKSLKRPALLAHLGGTPLHDLVIHEKYGAAIDAGGDLWMWGKGYDADGAVGRSLRGKKLVHLAAGPGKLFGLSRDGRIYVVSMDRQIQEGQKKHRNPIKRVFTRDPIVDYAELDANQKFHWGEYWTSLSVGQDHLLALTNHGRTFSLPLSPAANSHRQLGTKQTFPAAPETAATAVTESTELPAALDPRFATKLTEIPALSGIEIAEIAASARSSFVRTPDGRVLGFGANDAGQIGLGNASTVSIVPTPVEIALSKAYPSGVSVRCVGVAAGAQTTFFTVQRSAGGDYNKPKWLTDVLSCGNGQNGTLGTAMWSSATYAPAKIKTISGLEEYSDKEQAMVPLSVYSLSVSQSPTTHVFAVLDTMRDAETTKGLKENLFGKDVMVWGGNTDYQLGTGKRSALAVPTHLPSIIPHAIDTLIAEKTSEDEPANLTRTRLSLHTNSKVQATDIHGKVIKKSVKTQETIHAGWNCSVLYHKIVA